MVGKGQGELCECPGKISCELCLELSTHFCRPKGNATVHAFVDLTQLFLKNISFREFQQVKPRLIRQEQHWSDGGGQPIRKELSVSGPPIHGPSKHGFK